LVLDRPLDPFDQSLAVLRACVEEYVAVYDVGADRLEPDALEATFEPSHLHLRATAHVDTSKERDVRHAVSPNERFNASRTRRSCSRPPRTAAHRQPTVRRTSSPARPSSRAQGPFRKTG